MPAVQLIRLRTQIQDILDHFAEPAILQRGLRDLLDLYANRAFRPGQASIHQTMLENYLPPPLVMRELEIAFTHLGKQSGGAALRVVSVLRHDPALEPRILAAHLLGSIDPHPADPLLEEIRAWCTPEAERQVLDAILDHGCARLRAESESAWRGLVNAWIIHPETEWRMIGLRAMLPAIRDEQFINLPPLLSMISPLMQSPSPDILGDLQDILQSFISRSPSEAVFYLRQMLTLSGSLHTLRLARRLLPLFPPENQESLRTALRAHRAAE
ncbi:MAG TPA: hypothetical protein VFF78_07255 [Anaerolineaceae bacterium]|nr:hypothetical protein [Anaerolineaceae bacterium]